MGFQVAFESENVFAQSIASAGIDSSMWMEQQQKRGADQFGVKRGTTSVGADVS